MDPELGGDPRLVFIFREPQEPVICGAEKASLEPPRALPSASSDACLQSISPSCRAGDLHPECAASQPRHSEGPRSTPGSGPPPALSGNARLLLLQKLGKLPLHRHLLSMARVQEGLAVGTDGC